MNFASCNTPNRGTNCGNGNPNYPRPGSTFYSGPRTYANPSASCTGLYPRGTQHGYDPNCSLPNMMSTVGQQQPYGYSQRSCQPTSRGMQQVGRCGGRAATPSAQMQMQMQQRTGGGGCGPCGGGGPGPSGAAPNPFSTSNPICPVNVNISAAQLAAAGNTPIHGDRAECGADAGVKYIPMNWEDILGKTGMNGMKVSMVPGCGDNGNRQLKVSFGGQSGQLQEGETPLKVVSFQPVSTGRIEKAAIAPGAPGSSRPMGLNLDYGSMGQPQPGTMFDGRRQGQCSCYSCRK